jgi:hypothetical protein
MKYIAASLLTLCFAGNLAHAANFPKHADICIGGIVSKEKLAKELLKQHAEAVRIYVDTKDGIGGSEKWRRIFTDQDFCATDAACIGPSLNKPAPGQKPIQVNTAATKVISRLQFDFANALQTNVDGKHYAMARPLIGTEYLNGPDTQDKIACVGPELPVAPKPTVLQLPIRLRAYSDDLNIDASRDKTQFRNAKPAVVSFTRDDLQRSGSTKLQGALGYVVPLEFEKPTGLTYFSGELIPYISATQSIAKVDGRPATYAETNSVAVGALINTQTVFSAFDEFNNVLAAKPQYLWNTKDRSEIASLKFIYQPWSYVLNTPIQIGEFFGAHWLTLLFDVRSNTGMYTNIGTDIDALVKNKSFNRTGSRFGLAFTTDPSREHMVLRVTQTLLYGFAGSERTISLFDSSLSYYFDSTENFGVTVSYTKGQNEDTALQAQTWTAGLSAKF